ncbi:unnamed protein product, partial [marine sediment metagenome]
MYGLEGRFLKPDSRRPELAQELANKVIDEVSFARPNFYFTGGEPLVYKHIVSLVGNASKKGCACEINTNGLLLSKFAADLVDAGLSVLTVSILGPSQVHDGIVGVPQAFDRVIEGIEAILQAKARRRSLKPVIRINSAIIPENYEKLQDIVQIAEYLRADKLTFIHPR